MCISSSKRTGCTSIWLKYQHFGIGMDRYPNYPKLIKYKLTIMSSDVLVTSLPGRFLKWTQLPKLLQAVQLFLNLQNPLLAQECDPKWPQLAANLLILAVRILVEFSWFFRIIPPLNPLTCSYAPWEFRSRPVLVKSCISPVKTSSFLALPMFFGLPSKLVLSCFVWNMGLFRGGLNPISFPWFEWLFWWFDGYPTGENPTISCGFTTPKISKNPG